jgi:hypothetical protein
MKSLLGKDWRSSEAMTAYRFSLAKQPCHVPRLIMGGIKTSCFPKGLSANVVLSAGAGKKNLSFINITATSNCLNFNNLTFGVNFVNDSDTADFVSVLPFEFAVQLFDMMTEKRLSAKIIDTLVYPSFCISILFFVVFVSLVGDKDFIHLL